MDTVILQSKFADFVRQTIRQAYTGAQEAQRLDRLPVYAVESITFDVIIVTDDGLNFASSDSIDIAPETQSRQQMPEIRQVTTRTSVDSGKTLSQDDGKEISTSTDDSVDEGKDESSNKSTSTSTDKTDDTQTTVQTRGTEELTTDQTYS